MSLLMDALRKAEEAKKKAAQESNSEDASPAALTESQQANVPEESASEPHGAPKVELSMEAIEEVTTRSAVPTLDTLIEFEDEEDYVLPTSLGTTTESEANIDSNSDQVSPAKDETPSPLENSSSPEELSMALMDDSTEDEPETSVPGIEGADSSASEEPAQPLPAKSEPESFELDSFENVENIENIENIESVEVESNGKTIEATVRVEESTGREVEPTVSEPEPIASKVSSAPLEGKNPEKPLGSPMRVGAAAKARERERSRNEPGRKTARNVFIAKKSLTLNARNTKTIAGAALGLVIVVFGVYFYTSLNTESTFNIPAGNYSTAEFVDAGLPDAATGEVLVSDVAIAEIGQDTVIDSPDSPPPEQLTSGTVENTDLTDATVAAVPAEANIEPPVSEVVRLPQPSRSAASLQPETIATAPGRAERIVTTIGDTTENEPELVAELEQSDVTIDLESAEPAEVVEPRNLISFRKQETAAVADPNVELAYEAYQQGALDEAEVLYRQILASDSLQRDALLGLASIAAQKGDSTEALDFYSRLLARNPSDPIARAGLLELLPAGSPSQHEAELKRLLNDYPNIAALSYAYGNFLSSNQRWSAAQQAYFRALQLAKSDAAVNGRVNPDYAFNLAVSLEHLNQSEPARNYYQEALSFAVNHPASFDLNAVRNRLISMAGNDSND